MENTGNQKIIVDFPCTFFQILTFQTEERAGEHGKLYLKGISKKKIEEYQEKIWGEINICVRTENREIFFSGIVMAISTRETEFGLEIELEAVSYTKKLDITERIQSFLEEGLPFFETIKKIMNQTGKNDSLFYEKEMTLPYPLLQYQETDWQFVKRVASLKGYLIFADTSGVFPRIRVGIPNWGMESNKDPSIKMLEKKTDTKMGTRYKIQSRRNYACGEAIQLEGERLYVIVEKRLSFEQGEVIGEYLLRPAWEINLPYQPNFKIKGRGLPATVKERERERIRVCLDTDMEEDRSKWKIPYALKTKDVYCMPDLEARVTIYFPTEYEWEALAVESRRAKEDVGLRERWTEYPEQKSFTDRFLGCVLWNPKGTGIYPDFDGESFIELDSKGNIRVRGNTIEFHAADTIRLGSKKGEKEYGGTGRVEIRAGEEIVLGRLIKEWGDDDYFLNPDQFIQIKEGVILQAEDKVRNQITSTKEERERFYEEAEDISGGEAEETERVMELWEVCSSIGKMTMEGIKKIEVGKESSKKLQIVQEAICMCYIPTKNRRKENYGDTITDGNGRK